MTRCSKVQPETNITHTKPPPAPSPDWTATPGCVWEREHNREISSCGGRHRVARLNHSEHREVGAELLEQLVRVVVVGEGGERLLRERVPATKKRKEGA